MNDYGFDITEYANNLGKCTTMLSKLLNKNKLGLYLGAGASIALGLPNWEVLIRDCIADLPAGAIKIPTGTFDPKAYADKFKEASGSEYLNILHKNLYKDVSFEFNGVKKEMLIALSSLMVGKVRGNVRNIITLNFDDVLEWYLEIIGLRVNVIDKRPLHSFPSDVDVLHLHGFLPFNTKWVKSDKVVLTEDEFLIRERGNAYEKNLIDEFYKTHVFLGIGLNPISVCNDIVPYLKVLSAEWYDNESLNRGYPFGFVFLTNCSTEQEEKMLRAGVIPCVISKKEDIPMAIFEIAQKSARVPSGTW